MPPLPVKRIHVPAGNVLLSQAGVAPFKVWKTDRVRFSYICVVDAFCNKEEGLLKSRHDQLIASVIYRKCEKKMLNIELLNNIFPSLKHEICHRLYGCVGRV